MMQFPLTLSKTQPILLAVLSAAKSAMATLILSNPKTIDLSRLSLIRFSIRIDKDHKSDEVSARAAISSLKMTDAGEHQLVRVELIEDDLAPFAAVDFEIIDRKRGLKSAILQGLCTAKTRLLGEFDRKEVVLENIFLKFPDLRSDNLTEENWPFEALLIAALSDGHLEQVANIEINFHVYGTASSRLPCEVLGSQRLGAKPGMTEIIQENVLIAQVN